MDNSKKTNLVLEMLICEDPLCGSERYCLNSRRTKSGWTYFTEDSSGEENQVAESPRQLNPSELTLLLDKNNWFNLPVLLDQIEWNGSETIDRLFGGKHPIISIHTKISILEKAAHTWVVNWAKMNKKPEDLD
jgi:hypothetical protein